MLVTTLRETQFALDNFRGPLEFLLQLVQRKELDICDIPLQTLVMQFLSHLAKWNRPDVNAGAEFVGTLASLALFKSRILLPPVASSVEGVDHEVDCGVELLQKIVEYCQLKELAQNLTQREQQFFLNVYPRGIPPSEKETSAHTSLGIDHLTLSLLQSLLNQALKKAPVSPPSVYQEPWKVSDKVQWIQQLFKSRSVLPVAELLTADCSRKELIVIFLAILELMKNGCARLSKEEDHDHIVLST